MINLNFTDQGTINTLLTGSRIEMTKKSINNAKVYDIVVNDNEVEDLENDMP